MGVKPDQLLWLLRNKRRSLKSFKGELILTILNLKNDQLIIFFESDHISVGISLHGVNVFINVLA